MSEKTKIFKRSHNSNKPFLLSYPISNSTPMYGNENLPIIKSLKKIINGDSCNMIDVSFSNHTGTHIDCPFHFDQNGKKLTEYPVDFWSVKSVELIELKVLPEPGTLITPELLFDLIGSQRNYRSKAIILKTGYGKRRGTKAYWENPPGIDPECYNFLRTNFPAADFFGFDLISLTSYAQREIGKKAHKKFLVCEKPILVIEDMNLSTIPPNGIKNILIAPLFIEDADGSPCTIFANL
ncbi:MAG: cyclase family protein [Pseudomonadota bacterium]